MIPEEQIRNSDCRVRNGVARRRGCRRLFRNPQSAFRISRAFTLIEVLIAIMIFSLVVAAIYSVWALILRATKVGEEAAAVSQRQRIAIQTIEDSLTCIQSFQASMKYYTFVVNNENQGESTLSYTARVPEDFPRSGRFGDFTVRRLIFSVEPASNPDGTVNAGAENDLVLRQYPILTGMDPDEEQTPFVLARNVKTFKVECLDSNTQEWEDDWLDTNSIPPSIRVTLILNGANNNPAPALSVTRVISVPSETMPTAVQLPSQAGGGGQNGGINIHLGGNNGGNNGSSGGASHGGNGSGPPIQGHR